MQPSATIKVNSPNVQYTADAILSKYEYAQQLATRNDDGSVTVTPRTSTYHFRTQTKVPKTGLMMVGWGGNNGSTLTGAILANKLGLSWHTRTGKQEANYFGSITQASTVAVGQDAQGETLYVPMRDMLPMVAPNDLVLGGWDINSMNLADAMGRAGVFEYDLRRQLEPHMRELVPLPSVYYPDFIAANQSDRADNVLPGKDKKAHLAQIRQDIANFRQANELERVVVCWTANTERFADIVPGVNDTADNLMAAIEASHEEVSPSTLFAVACILEGVPFINGSPQNTFVPGCVELAERHRGMIAGDDFKSGQTKMKSVLVDFLVNAGIKPVSITSYNHLGNNDGKNLSAPSQFRSKEISKSNVVDDMVAANPLLYGEGEHPDHVVVIKYVPTVGDSKRALDEYVSEIFMGGRNTISMHNTCEDSLLASPLILDLAIMAELMTRVTYKVEGQDEYLPFHSVLSILSYMLKAPMVQQGTPVINSLFKQRAAIENLFRAFLALPPNSDMLLEHKVWAKK